MTESPPLRRIGILVTRESWFLPYARTLRQRLQEQGYRHVHLWHDHKQIIKGSDVTFFLSYFAIVPEEHLKRSRLNLVAHASNLPQGRGWAPYFWQIIEGKNRIPIVLFDAQGRVDRGDIYLRRYIRLQGAELHDELRDILAKAMMDLCQEFLNKYPVIRPKPQKGRGSTYPRRSPADSRLNVGKSIREQFNLLRTVNNEEFPAFFEYRGKRFVIKIEEARDHE